MWNTIYTRLNNCICICAISCGQTLVFLVRTHHAHHRRVSAALFHRREQSKPPNRAGLRTKKSLLPPTNNSDQPFAFTWSTMSARQAGATNLTQGSENFGYSAARLRRIVKLQFGIVNPNEMVRSLADGHLLWTMLLLFNIVVSCILCFSFYSSCFVFLRG